MNTSKKIDAERVVRFQSVGYDVLDDVMPADVASAIYDAFVSASWGQRHDQVRPDHFKHVFATESSYLPKGDEIYLARFTRSDELESNETVWSAVREWILPPLSEFSGVNITDVDLRCIAMGSGDFMRVHIDDYAGEIGFIYYVNRRWVWDWGGMLAVADSDKLKVVTPRYNTMAVVSHEKSRVPHFVTQIAEYALEQRFTIVGFCK